MKKAANRKPLSKAEADRDYWKQQTAHTVLEAEKLIAEVARLKQELATFKSRCSQAEFTAADQMSELDVLRGQLAKCRDTVKLRDEKIAGLQLLVRDLTRDLQELSGLTETALLPPSTKFKDVLEGEVKNRKKAQEELKRVQQTLRQATSECVQLRADVSRLQAVVDANQTTSTQLHEARVERNRLAQELATAQCVPEQREWQERLHGVLDENRILNEQLKASKNHCGLNPPPFTASISVTADGVVTFSHSMTQQPAERPVYRGSSANG